MAKLYICSFLVFVLTVGLVYVSFNNSLDNAFVFDDHLAITNNNDVKDPSRHNLWTNDIWGKELSAHDSHKSFRPLLIGLFRSLWSISSEARWFREVSLAAHCVATWLFFHLSVLIWGHIDLSLASSLLFAVHPIHVESVAAVVNMAEAFSAIFIMLSYIMFLRAIQRAGHSKSSLRYWLQELCRILVWVVLVVLASLFKETGITSSLLVAAKCITDAILWFVSSRLAAPRKSNTVINKDSTVVGVSLLYSGTAVMMTYVYLSFRTLMTSPRRSEILSSMQDTTYNLFLKPLLEQRESYLDTSQLLRKTENPFAKLEGWEKIYSSMYLHYLYMVKLVYPTEQSPEYAFNCIPKVASAEDPRVLLSLAMYATLVLVGLAGVYVAVSSQLSLLNSAHSAVVEAPPTVRDDNSEIIVTKETGGSATPATSPDAKSNVPTLAEERPTVRPVDAILHTLMLLVVFFLPASGLVFKLGTLLAERLMYTPSLASCMFIAAVVHGLVHGLVNILCKLLGHSSPPSQTGESPSFKKRDFVKGMLFWSIIAVIVAIYTQRTQTYNKVWKDDNTLFLESLAVCPQSAKMNLQVSKVYSQRGDFKKARKHLTAAQRIDPDFCDTGYQDVVITMAVAAKDGQRNSLDVAAEKAIKNLHCIYTNTATITLLNHLWSSQLQSVQATNNKDAIYRELEKQGDIAFGGDVQFLAAQKYIEASSIAFDAQRVDRAVDLATKAENIVNTLEATRLNATLPGADDSVEISAEVRCRIYTLGGLFRTAQLQAQSQAKPKKTKKNKGSKVSKDSKASDTLTQRTRELLHRAVFTDCMQAAVQLPELPAGMTAHNSVVVEHLPLAINHLVSIWTLQMSGSQQKEAQNAALSVDAAVQPPVLESYAQDLASVLYITEMLFLRTSYYPTNAADSTAATVATERVGIPKVRELCEVLRKLASNAYHLAGTKYLHAQDLASAVQSFQRALLVHSAKHTARVVDYKYGHTSLAPRESGMVPVVDLGDFRNVTLTPETCTSLHWLSETIAGTPDFQHNLSLVQEVQLYLKKLIKCLQMKIYQSPKLDMNNLRVVLKSLSSSTRAATGKEFDVAS